jgi:hypothetical protein
MVDTSCGRISFPLLSVVKVPIRHQRKICPYRAIRDALGIVDDNVPGTDTLALPGVHGGVLSQRPALLPARHQPRPRRRSIP